MVDENAKQFLLSPERIDKVVSIHLKYFVVSCGVVASSAFLALITVPFHSSGNTFSSLDWARVEAIVDVGYVMIIVQAGIIEHLCTELFSCYLVGRYDELSKLGRNGLSAAKAIVNVILLIITAAAVAYVHSINKSSGPDHFFHVLAIATAAELVLLTTVTVISERTEHVKEFQKK